MNNLCWFVDAHPTKPSAYVAIFNFGTTHPTDFQEPTDVWISSLRASRPFKATVWLDLWSSIPDHLTFGIGPFETIVASSVMDSTGYPFCVSSSQISEITHTKRKLILDYRIYAEDPLYIVNKNTTESWSDFAYPSSRGSSLGPEIPVDELMRGYCSVVIKSSGTDDIRALCYLGNIDDNNECEISLWCNDKYLNNNDILYEVWRNINDYGMSPSTGELIRYSATRRLGIVK